MDMRPDVTALCQSAYHDRSPAYCDGKVLDNVEPVVLRGVSISSTRSKPPAPSAPLTPHVLRQSITKDELLKECATNPGVFTFPDRVEMGVPVVVTLLEHEPEEKQTPVVEPGIHCADDCNSMGKAMKYVVTALVFLITFAIIYAIRFA